MPSQRLVESYAPTLPFWINDHGQDSLFNITLAGGNGVVAPGTVLGKVTATGKYRPYNNGNADGSETAVGLAMDRYDTTGGDVFASMMVHGVVRTGSLVGLDAPARADLTHIIFM